MMRSMSVFSMLLWARKRILLVGLLIGILLAAIYLWPAANKLHWRLDWSWYDLGLHGLAPLRSYRSFNHSSIDIKFLRQDDRCSRDYLFLASRGSDTEPGATILDHNGELIWRQPRMGDETHDFRVQEYKGKKYLTFWSGKPDKGGKIGSWYMMDETYSIKYQFKPSAGYTYGDMHEFQLTPTGTALLTIYPSLPADLSAIGGAKQGYMLDGAFQEINIETGELLFQWNASSHIPLATTHKQLKGCSDDPKRAFLGCGNTADAAFDYYHINSVQKDDSGNYLVSGRHTSSLTYINGKTGETIWTMGGDLNDFDYEDDGAEKLFSWQHHARIYNDSTITLLDNNAYSYLHARTESRGLQLNVDISNRKVRILHDYRHPQQRMSYSQGNMQVLDSGNMFVGWGNCAAFTEFSPDGQVLCDARFAPAAFFSFQPLSSYRSFRGTWIGKPNDEPRVATAGGQIYVSWNGATEVVNWRVEGAVRSRRTKKIGKYEPLATVPKEGFETTINSRLDGTHNILRVVALDKNGKSLGTSESFDTPVARGWLESLDVIIFTFLMIAIVGFGVWFMASFLCRRLKRHEKGSYKPIGSID